MAVTRRSNGTTSAVVCVRTRHSRTGLRVRVMLASSASTAPHVVQCLPVPQPSGPSWDRMQWSASPGRFWESCSGRTPRTSRSFLLATMICRLRLRIIDHVRHGIQELASSGAQVDDRGLAVKLGVGIASGRCEVRCHGQARRLDECWIATRGRSVHGLSLSPRVQSIIPRVVSSVFAHLHNGAPQQ